MFELFGLLSVGLGHAAVLKEDLAFMPANQRVIARMDTSARSHEIDWSEFAVGSVEEWESDLRARMIGCISGTVGG